jgi:hypothetical protein
MKKILATAIVAALAVSVPAVSHADHWQLTQKEAKAKIKKKNQWAAQAKKRNADIARYLVKEKGWSPYYARKALREWNEKVRGYATHKRNFYRDRCCSDTERGPMGGVGGTNTGF